MDIEVLPSQMKVLTDKSPQIALVCPRGYGKSYINALWCVSKLLLDPVASGIFVAPTHSQANETLAYMIAHCNEMGLEYVMNKRPSWCKSNYADHKGILSVRIKKGVHSFIRIKSAEKFDNLRSFSVAWIALDEAAMLREEVLDTVTPCLRGLGADYPYQILFTTTPRGITKSWFYARVIELGKASVVRASAIENFHVWNKEKIEEARESMTDIMFRQEILGEFVDRDMNMMAYAFHGGLVSEKQPEGRLCISSDQNVSPLCTGIFYVDGQGAKAKINMVDEIILNEANIQNLVTEFHKKINKPQTIYLYGDRSGNNRNWYGTGSFYKQLKTRFKLLGYNIIDKTNTSNPKVLDSNEVLNRMFEKNLFNISPKCKTSIEHIKKATWVDGMYVMNKKAFDAHVYDLIRYIAYSCANITKAKAINLPRY